MPPPDGWPREGSISFENYGLRYRPGLDLALRNVNCNINGGEKIGIVGRTGAGKSSLASGLFRLMEAATGEIRIDGHPSSTLGLHQLRGSLSIIPQDPLVFSGSLRVNLDPHGDYDDDDLWRSLELSHLKDFVSSLSKGLFHEVIFPVLESELRMEVEVLDEATGAVDMETDALVQTTLKEAFPTATILTIAHRLNTIIDSDRIMVLEAGSIVEMDSPSKLLADSNSRFNKMCGEAGLL